jgi:hypothetical protein
MRFLEVIKKELGNNKNIYLLSFEKEPRIKR